MTQPMPAINFESGGRAVGAGDLHRDDGRAGVDPTWRVDPPAARRAVAGDEAGHERAVAVPVDAVTLTREVGAANEAIAAEIGGRVHAGVDQCDTHTVAGVVGPVGGRVDRAICGSAVGDAA